ncbi:hypothetical protein F4561_002078 [Lipingzhangella halophila]|uniref:Secreted protein n=1 Tax=Lipingzhangella halophila TaxID=1783352 RepID=A0A7W7W2B4_9ACTN|nr:hypothetical protein [Lipingzhangella halophila]MBB4931258.1 hypothetical protein [Lipingzhangella halophila]
MRCNHDGGTSARPLLFLDVDGPLNPYAGPRRALYRAGYRRHRLEFDVMLRRSHGAALLALPFELVWATTWEYDANISIAPRIGLPELPFVEWPETTPEYGGVYFKTACLVDYAAGRPFAWVDDEIADADREFVAEHHRGPALLHHVDPAVGMSEEDFAALTVWGSRVGPIQ